MTKITHSDMKRGRDASASTTPPQTHVVEDLTSIDDRIAAYEGTAVETEQIPEPPAPELDDDTKKALEELIFMGRHTKTLEFAGHKFELGTLTHRENNDIVRELMKFGDAADLFTIRVLTLSYALRSIDDVKLDDIEIGDFEDDVQKRMIIIENLQLSMVERLHSAYDEMVAEADKVVYNEEKKDEDIKN